MSSARGFAQNPRTRRSVEVFYEAALAAGGCDNGNPGLHLESYWAYFTRVIKDSDWLNIRNSEGLQEIVVTCTLIRGVAPVGTEVTTLTREDIVSTGVVSTQDLLSTMPQITSAFNQHQNPNSSTGGDIVRPNIHNIGTAGGNTTLVLFDGHDVVGSGIYQSTPDIGVIPPNVLQSVQVIADGGSA